MDGPTPMVGPHARLLVTSVATMPDPGISRVEPSERIELIDMNQDTSHDL